jgi:hypothetical protein
VCSLELQRETGSRGAGAYALRLRIVPECAVNPVGKCVLAGFIGVEIAVADFAARYGGTRAALWHDLLLQGFADSDRDFRAFFVAAADGHFASDHEGQRGKQLFSFDGGEASGGSFSARRSRMRWAGGRGRAYGLSHVYVGKDFCTVAVWSRCGLFAAPSPVLPHGERGRFIVGVAFVIHTPERSMCM